MGSLRMQQLALECENLASHVHVSTAYVNCNRDGGLIEEKIFDLEGNEDPEDIIAKIQSMNPQYIADNEKTLIGRYPNTYTYTKSMAERTFKKRCGNLKAAIVRPSSITACLNEPVPGWTDTLAATGGMCLSVGMGIIHYVKCSGDTIFDIIPADLVSNLVITSAYFRAIDPAPGVHVLNSATSEHSPCKISAFRDGVINYVQYYPYFKQPFKPWTLTTPTDLEYKVRFGLTEQIPLSLMKMASRVPGIGNK
jgi:hypothetical protein